MPSQQIEPSEGAGLDHRPDLVVLLGPTCVGKSEIAVSLAELLDGEIVSADSRLFYRGLDIGTAKPTLDDRRRVPHHLIDVADPDQTLSLALFQQLARTAIAEIHTRGRMPYLVGGTGQYIRAVIEGWQAPGVEAHPVLRSALEQWAEEIGKDGLYSRLAVLDPQAAAIIDPHNLRRTVRALEVILSTGQRFSEQRRREPSPYRLLLLGLTRPRPELYARLDARIDAMIRAGFVDEVRRLLDKGYSPELPSLSAIGYREIVSFLQGSLSLDDAIREIRRLTRLFVRRQANWFKLNDPDIHWFDVNERTMDEMLALITQFHADPHSEHVTRN
jgi:tRNA dimethylallyltransferase